MSEVKQQQKEPINWYQIGLSFVSLNWLDGAINFVFRLVAKLSEVLLAIGIIVSAADFLLDGQLMQNNPFVSGIWAWTQAIAIESSSGVVLLYSVEAFRDKDYLKGSLYAALAVGLAIVGAIMLLTQLVHKTTGINWENSGNLYFVIGMAIARSIVSIAYIVMCRVKHISFAKTDSPVSVQHVDIQTQIDTSVNNAVDIALANIFDRLEVSIQQTTRTVVKEITQEMIAIPKQIDSPKPTTIDSKLIPDKLSIAKQALTENPDIKDKELATLLHVNSITTARSWKSKALAEMNVK